MVNKKRESYLLYHSICHWKQAHKQIEQQNKQVKVPSTGGSKHLLWWYHSNYSYKVAEVKHNDEFDDTNEGQYWGKVQP